MVDPQSYYRNIILRFFMKLAVVCFILRSPCRLILLILYTPSSAENLYAFRSDLTSVSAYLKKRCTKGSTYLILDKFSVQTTD